MLQQYFIDLTSRIARLTDSYHLISAFAPLIQIQVALFQAQHL